MQDTKTYEGSCHCGKVRFEVRGSFEKAGACNCSICSRVGWLVASVSPAQFELKSGQDAQSDYQFGKETMHHLFCKTCGIHAYGTYAAQGSEKILVNLRCIDAIDLDSLELEKFDGKSW